MLSDYFSTEHICIGSSFGEACNSLLKEMVSQKDLIAAIQCAFENQLVLGQELGVCHPDQNFDEVNSDTFPFYFSDEPEDYDLKLRYPLSRPFIGPVRDCDCNDGYMSWYVDPDTFERLVDCIEQWQRWDAARTPDSRLEIESKLSHDPKFSVGEIKKICGLGNDTIRKYGKPALGRWIGRGKHGNQFSELDVFKIICAIHDEASELDTKAKCASWIKTISEVNP